MTLTDFIKQPEDIKYNDRFGLDECPEGHSCDSDCQKHKECPCNEHEHTMTAEEKRIAGL